mmetsp:Transcript_92830/g.165040  ORF Transcript_92830/g.165040 Transcript_92830/m.165040 type:complete len:83 (-) Transcript_92830:8-256(-)
MLGHSIVVTAIDRRDGDSCTYSTAGISFHPISWDLKIEAACCTSKIIFLLGQPLQHGKCADDPYPDRRCRKFFKSSHIKWHL